MTPQFHNNKFHNRETILGLINGSIRFTDDQMDEFCSSIIDKANREYKIPHRPQKLHYAETFQIKKLQSQLVEQIDNTCVNVIGVCMRGELLNLTQELYSKGLNKLLETVKDVVDMMSFRFNANKVYGVGDETRIWKLYYNQHEEEHLEGYIHNLDCLMELREFDPVVVIQYMNDNHLYFSQCHSPVSAMINSKIKRSNMCVHYVKDFDKKYLHYLVKGYLEHRIKINFIESSPIFKTVFSQTIEKICEGNILAYPEIYNLRTSPKKLWTHLNISTFKKNAAIYILILEGKLKYRGQLDPVEQLGLIIKELFNRYSIEAWVVICLERLLVLRPGITIEVMTVYQNMILNGKCKSAIKSGYDTGNNIRTLINNYHKLSKEEGHLCLKYTTPNLDRTLELLYYAKGRITNRYKSTPMLKWIAEL